MICKNVWRVYYTSYDTVRYFKDHFTQGKVHIFTSALTLRKSAELDHSLIQYTSIFYPWDVV